ncbi:hypothetical protein DdX_04588 [Ditylenchus destructor]|uniref:Uncharacterized protein n=1 Tax=Ditylenchus destructor TaxID=166010 RepID=A0AAD4NF67_9BILA|nr:hypothetical protein DdX_04588 [Ditylenchus destructor]
MPGTSLNFADIRFRPTPVPLAPVLQLDFILLVDSLKDAANLQKFRYSGESVPEKEFMRISNLNSLTSLSLTSCPNLTDDNLLLIAKRGILKTTISSFTGNEEYLRNELVEPLEECMNRRPYASLRPASKDDPRLFHVHLYLCRFRHRFNDHLTFQEHHPILTQNLHPWIDYTTLA